MNDKKMKKLMKKEKKRRTARGFGAVTGTAAALAIIGILYGDQMKEDAKYAVEEAKAKLGLE